jgi:hypothetical protein
MWQRKLATLLDGRPAVLICLDSALLMQMKVDPRKGKQTTDVRTCQEVSSKSDLMYKGSLLFDHPTVEFKFWEMILVTDGLRHVTVSKLWTPCLAFWSCDGPYRISILMSFTLKMEAA